MSDEPDPGELAPIHSIEVAGAEGPVETASSLHNPCSHQSQGASVDPETRVVTCRRCDAVLDPVDALLHIARAWGSRWGWERDRLKAEVTRLRARVAVLKRDEANTRARLRRLGGKTA